MMITFPRTGNEIVCVKNPQFSAIQVQIDNKPYPDKPFSTLEKAHLEFNLINAGLDTIFQPQYDYVYSLQCKETTNGFKAGYVDWDNTNYCLVVATERLPNGHYFDGITLNNA